MRITTWMAGIFCTLALISFAPEATAQKKSGKPWKKENDKRKIAKQEIDFSYDGEALLFTAWMPRFQNGPVGKFQSWVQGQVVYPEPMKQQHIEGTVVAAFVINNEGLIRGIEILRTPHERLGQEVEKIMKLSKTWRPGYDAEGNPVDVRMTIAVNFAL